MQSVFNLSLKDYFFIDIFLVNGEKVVEDFKVYFLQFNGVFSFFVCFYCWYYFVVKSEMNVCKVDLIFVLGVELVNDIYLDIV